MDVLIPQTVRDKNQVRSEGFFYRAGQVHSSIKVLPKYQSYQEEREKVLTIYARGSLCNC